MCALSFRERAASVRPSNDVSAYMYIYMYVYMCMHACVCSCSRDSASYVLQPVGIGLYMFYYTHIIYAIITFELELAVLQSLCVEPNHLED